MYVCVCGEWGGEGGSKQLTKLETNCVIHPSLLSLRLPRLPGNPYFWKTQDGRRDRCFLAERSAASNPCDSSAAAAECNIITYEDV